MPLHLEVKLLNLSYSWQQYIIYLLFFCWFSMAIMNHFCTSQHMLAFPTLWPLERPSHFWSLMRRCSELLQSWEHLVGEKRSCICLEYGQGAEKYGLASGSRRREERENRAQGAEGDLSYPTIKGRLIVADNTCGKRCTLTVTVICQDWSQKWETQLW